MFLSLRIGRHRWTHTNGGVVATGEADADAAGGRCVRSGGVVGDGVGGAELGDHVVVGALQFVEARDGVIDAAGRGREFAPFFVCTRGEGQVARARRVER